MKNRNHNDHTWKREKERKVAVELIERKVNDDLWRRIVMEVDNDAIITIWHKVLDESSSVDVNIDLIATEIES